MTWVICWLSLIRNSPDSQQSNDHSQNNYFSVIQSSSLSVNPLPSPPRSVSSARAAGEKTLWRTSDAESTLLTPCSSRPSPNTTDRPTAPSVKSRPDRTTTSSAPGGGEELQSDINGQFGYNQRYCVEKLPSCLSGFTGFRLDLSGGEQSPPSRRTSHLTPYYNNCSCSAVVVVQNTRNIRLFPLVAEV